MILVLAGTREGREVVELLRRHGRQVLASAVSAYGGELAGADLVRVGALDREGMEGLLREQRVRALVDATHPYAQEASRNARAACRAAGVPYLRLERPPAALPPTGEVHQVADYPAAAELAVTFGSSVFLSTGSRRLAVFVASARPRGVRVVARVLPEVEALIECRRLGLGPADVVAMQGPFTRELNLALFRHYQAAVVVSKESGEAGGFPEKAAAAAELGLPLVVIRRGQADPVAVASPREALEWVLRTVP